MPAKPITIAGNSYEMKKDVSTRLTKMLYAGGPDDPITDSDDVALLAALFGARPEKIAELEGRKIVAWAREQNPATICFAAVCADGSKLHFSFPKSLTALYDAEPAQQTKP